MIQTELGHKRREKEGERRRKRGERKKPRSYKTKKAHRQNGWTM